MSSKSKRKDKEMWGLRLRGHWWHLDTTVDKRPLTGTTGCRKEQRELACLVRDKRREELKHKLEFGKTPTKIRHTFAEAAEKYLEQSLKTKRPGSYKEDCTYCRMMLPFLGHMDIGEIVDESLDAYREWRDSQYIRKYGGGFKKLAGKTKNSGITFVLRVLNAAKKWKDENNEKWLEIVPEITLYDTKDAKKAKPLSWDDQDRLFPLLHDQLRDMLTFKLNTGARTKEVRLLNKKWETFIVIQDDQGNRTWFSVFFVPWEIHKTGARTGEPKLIIVNDIAQQSLTKYRNTNSDYFFLNPKTNQPYERLSNTSWYTATRALNLDARIHDLRHTCGRRLRAAGVDKETRQKLLGHSTSDITTHYSEPELYNLYLAANKIIHRPKMTILRQLNFQQFDSLSQLID